MNSIISHKNFLEDTTRSLQHPKKILEGSEVHSKNLTNLKIFAPSRPYRESKEAQNGQKNTKIPIFENSIFDLSAKSAEYWPKSCRELPLTPKLCQKFFESKKKQK